MARKKKDQAELEAKPAKSKKLKKEVTSESATTWPIITKGSHSTRIEYEDGSVDFQTDWEALKRDVREAIREFEEARDKQKP